MNYALANVVDIKTFLYNIISRVITECKDGSFGYKCEETCYCRDDAACDHVTGECPGGECKPGWTGQQCSSGKFILFSIWVDHFLRQRPVYIVEEHLRKKARFRSDLQRNIISQTKQSHNSYHITNTHSLHLCWKKYSHLP